MSQYLLSVWHTYPMTAEDFVGAEDMYAAVDVFNQKLVANNQLVFAGGLHDPSTATVIRVGANGDVVMTDGPYAETKESFGGFWVIEASDLDAALALAQEGAFACGRPVEVRPFQDEPPSA